MGRGHEVVIGADARPFEKAVKDDLIKPVEQAARALDELGSDGSRDIGKLEDAMKDAQRQTDKLDRSVGKTVRGVDDLKNESNQTGREMAASFKEPADALDAVQELAANAFQGFGPAGAAAGLTAAVGLGLVTSEITKQQEAAKQLKAFFADAYRTAAEEGRKYLDAATVQAEAFDILYNSDRVDERNKAEKQAVAIGLDANTVILARAGDQASLNAVIEATTRAQEQLRKETEEGGSNAIRLSAEERRNLERIGREYQGIAELHDEEAQRAQQAQGIKDQLYKQERDQIKRTQAADQARYEALAKRAGQQMTIVPDVDLGPAQRKIRNWRPTINITGNISVSGRSLT